jgi:murein DD-endopeptidase MepM/ murein hydrolase activator NlpD
MKLYIPSPVIARSATTKQSMVCRGPVGLAMTIFLLCSSAGILQAVSGKQVTAGPDSTVYGIAHEHGIRTQALIQANNLKPPYVLKPGQVLTIPGPNEHVVGRGETVHSIAQNYGVKPEVLAQENGLQTPYYVKDGDALLIPSPDTESMAQALKAPEGNISTSSLAPLPSIKDETAPVRHENVSASGHANKALPDDLARELAQEKESSSHDGSGTIVGAGVAGTAAVAGTVASTAARPEIMGNLAGGGGTAVSGSASAAAAGAAVVAGTTVAAVTSSGEDKEEKPLEKPKKKEAKVEPKPEKKVVKKDDESEEKKVAKAEEKKEKPKVETSEVLFTWPVQGKILSSFKPGGKNDGINIEVPEGTSVKAAGPGEVMYSGNELKGFGELLLIKHEGGWMTAYAHNSELLVKKGDAVKQGQVIAKSGKTGDVKTPQLHFEVRKGKQPVDPMPKLGS